MSKFLIKRAADGVWYGLFAHLAHRGLAHGVSTRLGGLSVPPYAALNLGLKTGDDPEKVRHNRRLFAQAVGLDIERAVACQQVHGDHVHLATAADAGRGGLDHDAAIPAADALATATAGLPLILFFADCVPVLIHDPVRPAVAVVHAGWKGSVARIAAKTVHTMGRAFGTRPADCLVAIGPSIGPCCYEVDQPVIDALQEFFCDTWEHLVIPRGHRWLLDLWETNRRQLIDAGVPRENIEISGVCTACNTELFYSHRKEKGQTGRMGAIISL